MTFRARIFLAMIAVLIAALGTAVVGGARWLRETTQEQLADEAARDARLVAASLPRDPAAIREAARRAGSLAGRRVTVIDSTGRVLGDSEFDDASLALLDNHADRPEVAGALRDGVALAIRFSESTRRVEMKVAVRVWPGVVRVSVPTAQVEAIVADARRVALLAALVGLAVGGLLAAGGGRAVAQPLGQLSAAARTLAAGGEPSYPASTVPEVRQLVRAFRAMQEELDERIARLEHGREETRTLFDSMVEGVIAAGPDGEIVACNRAARRLFGYAPDAPLPNVRDLFRSPEAREVVDRVLDGSAVLGRETEFDGRAVLVTARPLPDAGAVLCLHDVSELRRLETVRRDFVANVSHELKTPLTSIAGYAETLRAGDVDPDTAVRFLDVMLDNAHRMHRLVDDLLDLARLESGGWRPALADVDPVDLARNAWAPMADRAEERGVGFQIDARARRKARVDADALRQILTNLFDNALRHTPPGGQITFATRHHERGIALAVQDTGSGIPAEHLPRLFERFYRVDPARSRDQGGTGLGLSIVRHLVEAHGGHVDLESAPGRGTTAHVVLPAAPN